MKIELILIGSELLTGRLKDQNGPFLCRLLWSKGFDVDRLTIVTDNTDDVENAIKQASVRSDIIITTGGLGPTVDDLTRKILSRVFKRQLILNEPAFNKDYKKNNYQKNADTQTLIPQGAEIIPNQFGTAPGLLIKSDKILVFSLPGVPSEMAQMAKNFVIPYIVNLSSTKTEIKSSVIKFTGISEIDIDKTLTPILKKDTEVYYSILPGLSEISLEIIIKSKDEATAEHKLNYYETKCHELLGAFIWGHDSDTMEKVIGDLLVKKNLTLAVAESCTGGLTGSRITNVPGSSVYFKGGVIAYDNSIKEKILKVSKSHLEKYGAVSSLVGKEMAANVRKLYSSDIGIGITGIAGPGGGTDLKPVGLVYIAIADKNNVICEKFLFNGDRRDIKEKSTRNALKMLRFYLI